MYLDFCNEKIYYSYENSTKPVVVFIHGLGGKAIYGEDFRKFNNRNYQLICFDLVGRGNSSYNQSLSLELWIKNIETVLEKLKVNNFYILAHSFGCYLTANLLLNKKFNIKNSLLITPYNPFVEPSSNFRQKILKIYPDEISEEESEKNLQNFYDKADKKITEEFEIFNFDIYKKDLKIMKKFTSQIFHDVNMKNDYEKSNNYEIIAADNDLVVPYDSVQKLADFKNKKTFVFKGGHDIIITHAKEINDLINKMVTK
ncbi:MAG: alpha/beta hydrolase [Malacoplasma sp.]|nr:alpha/beta hydrolase [Malacoplasma sp.]